MACFYPITGWRAAARSENGKRPIVFDIKLAYTDMPMKIPCGKCTGCYLARASSWAVRATHESGLHNENIFLTLTYDDDHLPDPPLVSKDAMQKFLKRLRKRVGTVRYLLCGEYGSKTFRPHYHLLIFGYRPDDAVVFADRPTGRVFTSATISKIWTQGLHEFGSVSPASAGYVARYTTKKRFESHEEGSEFLLSSRQPPLGIPWLEKHYQEFYPSDSVVLGGKKYRPPIAYDRWLEITHPELHKEVISQRHVKANDPKTLNENNLQRLWAREGALLDRIRGLSRGN